MPETNQKEFNGAILISENKDYSAYSPGDATHPLQPIAVSPSSENIANSLGKAARWIEVIDEKADKADNLSASSGINIYGDGSTGNPKKITNTGVNSVENTTVADTSATNGDIRIVNKTVNPSTGVVSDSVSYVKPKGINDPAFKALDSSTSGLTADDDHVPTSKTVQDAIDTALASASVYKGTIAAFNDLPTSTATVIVRKGWYYRVSTAWSAATGTPATDVGDIIIAEIDSPSKSIDGTNWSLLHNEANTDANVAQSPVSTNANYEVLFSGSADNTAHTEGTGKDSGLTYNPSTNKLTVSGEVSASSYSGLPEGNTTTKGIVQLGTDADKAASGNHGHGNITNDGAITESGADLANGDALVFADNSDSSKLKKTSITFDGATDTQALTKKGTWETFNNYTHPSDPGNKHIPANGATGNYLKYGGSSGTAAWAAPLTEWPATAQPTDNLPSTKLLDDRFKANETNILYSLNTGVKNLLPVFEGKYVADTTTFTVSADGNVSVVSVDTSTHGATFGYFNLKAGAYYFTDRHFLNVHGDAEGDVRLKLNGTPVTIASDGKFTLPQDSTVEVVAYTWSPSTGSVYPMICTEDAWNQSHDYMPFARPNHELTKLESEDRAALVECVDKGAKNQLTIPDIETLKALNIEAGVSTGTWSGNSFTYKGVTFTINYADNTITTSGTSTVDHERIVINKFTFKSNNDYMISGCPSGGSYSGYSIAMLNYNNRDTGGGLEVEGDNVTRYLVVYAQNSGTDTSGLTFKPMICTAEEWKVSQNFVPFARPNYDLTRLEAEDRAALVEQVDEGAKNKLKFNGLSNVLHNGVSFTLNSDNSITATRIESSENDSSSNLTYNGSNVLIDALCNGNYILSGCPEGGGSTRYDLRASAASSSPVTYLVQDKGEGIVLQGRGQATNISVQIRLRSTFTGSLTFKPMICTEADWNVSKNYDTYALPNSELTKEVNILRTSMDNLFRTPVFGFRINKNESNSSTAVEYLYDAVGMTPAYMDFTNSTFNYGSWGDAWFVKNNKPVALNFDGTEAFELDPTNWWKKSDGTTDSGIEDSSTTYNFMSRFPLVYINRWEDENYNYVAISERPVTPNFLAQAHTGLNGTINSNIYLPMFKGWIDGSTGGTISSTGKLRSLAGKWPSCGTDATEEFNAIKNITGSATSGWQLFAHSQYCLLNDLLTLISKSIDVKACFGRGDVSTYNTSDSTVRDGSKTGYANNGKYISGYEGYADGTTTKSTCGQFFGYDDATHHVTAFFVQDPWGNRWDRSPGLNRINRAYKVKMTPPYSMNSDSSYITAGIQTPSSEGWLRKISSSNTYGHLPFAVGDGAADTKNKYFWSYFYTNANTDEKLSLVGGSCGNGGLCSSRCVALHIASSNRSWGIGGSPCYVSP